MKPTQRNCRVLSAHLLTSIEYAKNMLLLKIIGIFSKERGKKLQIRDVDGKDA